MSSRLNGTLVIMDIEYYVETSQAKEQKIVAWGCFARCYFNWATISKGSAAA